MKNVENVPACEKCCAAAAGAALPRAHRLPSLTIECCDGIGNGDIGDIVDAVTELAVTAASSCAPGAAVRPTNGADIFTVETRGKTEEFLVGSKVPTTSR